MGITSHDVGVRTELAWADGGHSSFRRSCVQDIVTAGAHWLTGQMPDTCQVLYRFMGGCAVTQCELTERYAF